MIEYRLPEWGLTAPGYAEVRTNLFIVASELINNAMAETPDREIRINCLPDVTARIVRIAVWDSSERRPQARMPDLTLDALDLREESFDDNHGWGLPVVQALCDNCGIEPTKGGKWVWATVTVGGSPRAPERGEDEGVDDGVDDAAAARPGRGQHQPQRL